MRYPLQSINVYYLVCIVLFLAVPVSAQEAATVEESVDVEAIEFIRNEGLNNSQVMQTAWWLTDVFGPRLSGSPALMRASEWIIGQYNDWDIPHAETERWGAFGRGWSLNRFTMHVTQPNPFPVIAYPKAWSSGVDGRVSGQVVILDIDEPADLDRYRGQLSDKFVLIENPRDVEPWFDAPAVRRDAHNLAAMANASRPDQNVVTPRRMGGSQGASRPEYLQEKIAFLFDEQPLAILDRYLKGDGGTIFVSSAAMPVRRGVDWGSQKRSWDIDAGDVLPQITLAVEHFNRIYRLVEAGHTVQLEMELDVTFHEDDPSEYNVIAEIPGTDPEIGDEIVMLGAHLDSWHAGTGATDNGSGSSVVMEAMRILQRMFAETEITPRRTIRAALWTGEEQGLHGSRAYVNHHFAESEGRGMPPTSLKADYEKFSAYYNFDNGTGRIRGIYMQGNQAVEPIFRAWLEPFEDLDAGTLTIMNTGGTDHLSFDAVGLPGFQFIQDPIAYSSTTHHSNMDTFDHLVEDDLKQAAVIMAAFVYHTAQRDELLPRKPIDLPDASR